MIDLTKVSAASFMPGLQNSGQVTGTANISGVLSPSGTDGTTSNMTGYFTIALPDPSVISLFRISLPDAAFQLATKWFPLIGTVELTDVTNHYRLIIFVQSDPVGRGFSYNFVSLSTTTGYTASNYRILIYGHLFTYPWG
jgi:hypothetical protein